MSSTNHNQGVSDTLEHINAISVQVLIEGRDPLLEVLQNEEVTKGLVIEYTHTEPMCIYSLYKSTMLLIFNQNIDVTTLSMRMGAINSWLGKPVIIHSNMDMVEQARKTVQSHIE